MQIQIIPQLLYYTLPHHTTTTPCFTIQLLYHYITRLYTTLPLLYLASLYHYFTRTSPHSAWLDQRYHYFTSHNFTYTLHHVAQPHNYFTLSLYQINVYLFSTVRYNTLPSLNFASTKPNFTELNTNLAKHSNTNLNHKLPMLLCTKLKWTTWCTFHWTLSYAKT